MQEDSRITDWVRAYQAVADKTIAEHVSAIGREFPDEVFPVRPPYRKAMYQSLTAIVDELNQKMDALLDESPDETDGLLRDTLMGLQEGYEHYFIRQVRKVDEHSPIDASVLK